MSEPAFEGDAPVRGDWSQVFTGLDWVARWMAERGYSDAEISYVVERPTTPLRTVEVVEAADVPGIIEAVEPAEGDAADEADEVVVLGAAGAGQATWTVSLNTAEVFPAQGAETG
ncbi:MAG TPA: hypothetical protein VHG70_01060 [Nocardioidaceae bacterium]|nr:hypothetical protein [Nocardioidaceae bacterium]